MFCAYFVSDKIKMHTKKVCGFAATCLQYLRLVLHSLVLYVSWLTFILVLLLCFLVTFLLLKCTVSLNPLWSLIYLASKVIQILMKEYKRAILRNCSSFSQHDRFLENSACSRRLFFRQSFCCACVCAVFHYFLHFLSIVSGVFLRASLPG